MKPRINEVLNELVNFTDPNLKEVHLKQAYEKLGFQELFNLIKWILHWQKNIINENLAPVSFFHDDYFELDDVFQKRYPALFELCPALSEVYTLQSDKIIFNTSLGDEEKQEILEFIDTHHKIETRKRVRQK